MDLGIICYYILSFKPNKTWEFETGNGLSLSLSFARISSKRRAYDFPTPFLKESKIGCGRFVQQCEETEKLPLCYVRMLKEKKKKRNYKLKW
jgi:hypothetical protein